MFLETALDQKVRDVLPAIQNRILHHTTYFGITTYKHPCDLWIYQEIITALSPDVIIEIGTHCGGTTLALAHLCDSVGKGRVISIDVSQKSAHALARAHPLIVLIEGKACAVSENVKNLILKDETVLLIEDSSHQYDDTLNILRTYQSLIKPNGYFIVEDGICHHGLVEGPSPGPYEAIETFLKENADFVSDRDRESFILTWNPKGFLKRIK